ncbi:MAG: 4-alpha-glucanotransferase [Chromatiales bacterium]|jgi:4-alpha-glucanotransferase
MTSRLPPRASPLDRRRAGILLHPTSLPGPEARGQLGADAYRFVDFLAAAGITVWQMLPLGPTHGSNGSPYQCLSAHAGDPRLISVARLRERGWLSDEASSEGEGPEAQGLRRAREGFLAQGSTEDLHAYDAFLETHRGWLNDYVLFLALKREHGGAPWWEWEPELRGRDPKVLRATRRRLDEVLEQDRFEQFLFFRQWLDLKAYANERGILLFGDMPIFVAQDSADVWADAEMFDLDEHGQPRTVAGVPPDYFSATGQRWGNPHYDWERMAASRFRWWKARMHSQHELFDLIRIDHFRGFQAYWSIPAQEETAMNGHWVEVPGEALFKALLRDMGDLPLVAEDLGVITPEVEALRDAFGLPGMKILQFAFDGGPTNPYLSHNHALNCVVYTGTHDNDTTLGWFDALSPESQAYVMEYLGHPQEPMPWPMIREAYASVSLLSVVPMQDVLGLGAEARMNTPGTMEGNWSWRFEWDQVPEDLPARLRRLGEVYGRS